MQEVGTGRFKHVFRGFDEKQGIDVAWSKILQHSSPHFDLDEEQMRKIAAEMRIGLQLDHPNIIRCYKCWQDDQAHCINLVTEYFTSGNLRDYRQRHKHLELKAVRKWARQILAGLEYLHLKQPPIIHGDLRCDKIYVNGHSGEIKIGDLGLATLLPRRFEPGAPARLASRQGVSHGVAGGWCVAAARARCTAGLVGLLHVLGLARTLLVGRGRSRGAPCCIALRMGCACSYSLHRMP